MSVDSLLKKKQKQMHNINILIDNFAFCFQFYNQNMQKILALRFKLVKIVFCCLNLSMNSIQSDNKEMSVGQY